MCKIYMEWCTCCFGVIGLESNYEFNYAPCPGFDCGWRRYYFKKADFPCENCTYKNCVEPCHSESNVRPPSCIEQSFSIVEEERFEGENSD